MTYTKANNIAKKYKIGSVKTLRRLVKKVESNESLAKKKGQGRKTTICNDTKILQYFAKKANEMDYQVSPVHLL